MVSVTGEDSNLARKGGQIGKKMQTEGVRAVVSRWSDRLVVRIPYRQPLPRNAPQGQGTKRRAEIEN